MERDEVKSSTNIINVYCIPKILSHLIIMILNFSQNPFFLWKLLDGFINSSLSYVDFLMTVKDWFMGENKYKYMHAFYMSDWKPWKFKFLAKPYGR